MRQVVAAVWSEADALGELDLTGVEPGDYALGLSVALPMGRR